jgi:hypothetical protein
MMKRGKNIKISLFEWDFLSHLVPIYNEKIGGEFNSNKLFVY